MNIKDLCHCLSSKELKAIGIRAKKWLKCDLKKHQRDELDRMCFMDFINISDLSVYTQRFLEYLKRGGKTLNLTHMYSITPQILSTLDIQADIEELVIYQNFQLDNYSWLSNFPNLRLVNFWYNHRLEYHHVAQICELCPHLEVFNIHSCCRVNLRILIPILKLSKLQKLAIDDPSFWCQKGIHELFVLPNEWQLLSCPSLTKLAINSRNLTTDVVDYLIGSCPYIEQIIVDENILMMISRNICGGYDTETISFHSWQSPNKGLKINKKINFKNMFKDTYNSQMFSESMLRRIKEKSTN